MVISVFLISLVYGILSGCGCDYCFRGIRRDRVVLQSQIRRPEGDHYEGGYEHVEGYAGPEVAGAQRA